MKKQLLTTVLFIAPLYVAAYDYDKLPATTPAPEQEITQQEAFPDLTGKSYIEIEDITTKLDRLAKQAKFKEQRKKAQEQLAQQQNGEQEAAPATPDAQAEPANAVSATAIEDIDRKLDEAAKRKAARKQTQAPAREVWSADPETGTHDWKAAPQQPAGESNTEEDTNDNTAAPAESAEFPEE